MEISKGINSTLIKVLISSMETKKDGPTQSTQDLLLQKSMITGGLTRAFISPARHRQVLKERVGMTLSHQIKKNVLNSKLESKLPTMQRLR